MRSPHHQPLDTIAEPDTTSLGAFFVSFFNSGSKQQQGKLLEAYKEALTRTKMALREAADEIVHTTNMLLEGEGEQDIHDFEEYEDTQQANLDCHQEYRNRYEEAAVTYEDLLQSLEGEDKVPSTAAPSTQDPGSKMHSRTASAVGTDLVELGDLLASLPDSDDDSDNSESREADSDWDRCEGDLDDDDASQSAKDDWELVPSNNLAEPLPCGPPVLEEPSELLSVSSQQVLSDALPTALRGKRWQLLYTTYQCESSLQELYNTTWNSANLVVVQDTYGRVFGGFHSSPLAGRDSPQEPSHSFVYTEGPDGVSVFHSSDLETPVVHARKEYLAFGLLPEQYALWLDSQLMHGTSKHCDAFDNCSLANLPNFSISDVEVWGFAEA